MKLSKTFRDNFEGYLLTSPALVLYILFVLTPLIFGFYVTLHDWDGFTTMKFVGLKNYVTLLKNPTTWTVISHNLQYAAGTVLGKNILAIFLALLLNRKFKGVTIARTIYFIPVVMSFVAIGVLWSWLYNPTFGLINAILLNLNLISSPILFLGEPGLALNSLIFVDIWRWTGYHMVIILAGLQTVSADLYEAADIDGANAVNKLFSITIPQITPMIITNLTISTMGAFSVFDLVHVMTKGGPYNSTHVLSTYMYTITFGSESRFGYGSSVAYILLAIILIISLGQSWLMKKTDNN